MVAWRRITGVAGLAAGAVAAGAGAVVAAERIAIGRAQLLRDNSAAENFGGLRGRALTVLADDGVPLHVEIDDPDPASASASSALSPPGAAVGAGHHRVLPWLHAEPGLLAFPAPRPARSPARVLGPAGPWPVRPVPGGRHGQHRPARRRPRPGDRGGGARRHAGDPGRALDGRHDHHGAGRPAARAVRHEGHRGGAHLHHGQRPGPGQPVDARAGPAGAAPRAAGGAARRGHRVPGRAGGTRAAGRPATCRS